MKQTIRNKVFETNSSSVHSLTLVDEDTYNKFKSGELWFCRDTEELVSKEDIIKMPYFESTYPNYNEISEEDKEKTLNDFIKSNVDNDYSLLNTYNWVDAKDLDCYDENGKTMKVVSMYIPG